MGTVRSGEPIAPSSSTPLGDTLIALKDGSDFATICQWDHCRGNMKVTEDTASLSQQQIGKVVFSNILYEDFQTKN